MVVTSVQKAIDLINIAVEKDKNKEHREALKHYENGIEYFLLALKHDVSNQSVKKSIKSKVEEYLSRAETLKELINNEKEDEKKPKKSKEKVRIDKDSSDITNRIMGAIVKEKSTVTFDQVAGLAGAKQTLNEAVLFPLKFPYIYKGSRTPWRCILLYGPPGTGKSHLAKAIANESGDSTFFSISSADLISKYQGESEQLIKQLFKSARDEKPSIIFIDEIDSMLAQRGSSDETESMRRVKNQFLVELSYLDKAKDQVLILAATNIPWQLDAAMRRRFEKSIYIPLPDTDARKELFKIHLKDILNESDAFSESDYQLFAEKTPQYSGSDIQLIAKDASMSPVRLVHMATHFRKVRAPNPYDNNIIENDMLTPCLSSDAGAIPMTADEIPNGKLTIRQISKEDILKAISTQRPTVTYEDTLRHEQFTKDYGNAHSTTKLVISGHFKFNAKIFKIQKEAEDAFKIKIKLIVINLIRHPLEQFISHYYFLINGDNLYPKKTRLNSNHNISLDDCILYRKKFCDRKKMWNQLCRFCQGISCLLPNAQSLDLAINSVSKYYNVVGVLENYDGFIKYLHLKYPAIVPHVYINHLRKTRKKVYPLEKTIRFIKKWPQFKYEYEFYKRVQIRFNQQVSDYHA
ncbi:hypothetical protein A3Q56_03778 [Intoshia linei]|uniref:Vesicle-fusing ATPase n=1 Tax=Intoshia linei TaxID=1819745 RepID=A0A177B502_9BILA|nr:hypothetical protein A3Q56_03778 [Intoshia linei]